MWFILPDDIGARTRAATNLYGDAILHLAASGQSIKEIVCTLYLAVPTIEACLREIVATAPTNQIQTAIALLDGLETEVARRKSVLTKR